MNYSSQEVIQFVDEEDVKFIRLAFCDIDGNQKNISIMPNALMKAFSDGVSVDARVMGMDEDCEIVLHPEPDTLALLPWRPDHGRVVRMYCSITDTDGNVINQDKRYALSQTNCVAGEYVTTVDFYLFTLDESGNPTDVPYDNAGYMDIAPLDKCENIRRQICLTLEIMGVIPKTSCHSFGPGQNRISFCSDTVIGAADNLLTFASVARTMASSNGLCVDFSEKPIAGGPKNSCLVSVGNIKKQFSLEINPYISHLEFSEDKN